jgi:hypothetical protein
MSYAESFGSVVPLLVEPQSSFGRKSTAEQHRVEFDVPPHLQHGGIRRVVMLMRSEADLPASGLPLSGGWTNERRIELDYTEGMFQHGSFA